MMLYALAALYALAIVADVLSTQRFIAAGGRERGGVGPVHVKGLTESDGKPRYLLSVGVRLGVIGAVLFIGQSHELLASIVLGLLAAVTFYIAFVTNRPK